VKQSLYSSLPRTGVRKGRGDAGEIPFLDTIGFFGRKSGCGKIGIIAGNPQPVNRGVVTWGLLILVSRARPRVVANFSRNGARAAQQSEPCKRRVTMGWMKFRPVPPGCARKKRGCGVAKLGHRSAMPCASRLALTLFRAAAWARNKY